LKKDQTPHARCEYGVPVEEAEFVAVPAAVGGVPKS
jgi:hypothetical protein